MEHGFQTNVELMRANRPRWLERSKKNKWDDVLSFKPRPVRSRGDTPGEKPPWWRLGAKFEALVKDGGDDGLGYLNDLLEMEAEPEEEEVERCEAGPSLEAALWQAEPIRLSRAIGPEEEDAELLLLFSATGDSEIALLVLLPAGGDRGAPPAFALPAAAKAALRSANALRRASICSL